MTISKLGFCAAASMAVATAATAAQPGAAPIPDAVRALEGCWRGDGDVRGKPVIVALSSKSILQNAMFTVDVDSSAVVDPKDRYSAHLIFGGAGRSPDQGDDIVGFWADSFGGAYTALGRGSSRPDGFDVTYQYPGDAFVNRWTLSGDQLKWSIIERDGKRVEKTFAAYTLKKAPCSQASS